MLSSRTVVKCGKGLGFAGNLRLHFARGGSDIQSFDCNPTGSARSQVADVPLRSEEFRSTCGPRMSLRASTKLLLNRWPQRGRLLSA